ncbi:glycosyltransferase, partial [Streptomyces sp. NPDC057638]|uniref:glycosyltransferase n=1 Tax=Streptomyces sp. NPDC057638 TaxID=3346190 RepID=UPI0036C09A52
FAGAVAARACGAAHARMTWGTDFFGRIREQFLRLHGAGGGVAGGAGDPLGEWLGSLAGRYGVEFDEELTTGQFTLDQLPEAFRLPTSIPYVPVRYGVYNGASVVPRWLWEPPAGPRVGFTLGLSAVERLAGYAVSVSEILTALADLDVEVVATVDQATRATLPPLPDRVRVTGFVPLAPLAATSTTLIHHGGYGTIGTTSLASVPQLLMPDQMDAIWLSRGVTSYGAGIELEPAKASGERVVEEVRRLLGDDSYREGARRLRDDLLALPSPAEAVPTLVALTERHRQPAVSTSGGERI